MSAHPVFRLILLLLLISTGLNGCALVKLRHEVDTSQQSTIIVGRIYGDIGNKGQIIVAASPADDKNEIAHYVVLKHTGEYELIVTHGSYAIYAFWDKNNNLTYDRGEAFAVYKDGATVTAPAVGVVADIDIALPHEHHPAKENPIFEFNTNRLLPVNSHQAGDIAPLTDQRFAKQNGSKGFWEPLSFYREHGGNIYFLEPYDPDKIPILFIHGAAGTPLEWDYLASNIDRTRYQPWFFYYPSGVRIDSMAHLLFWKLINLQTRYQFKTLYITAHSMGGLLARQFLLTYGEQFPYVKLLVTLATPWGGDRMAEFGVQQSPAVIPSWIDMQPEGSFIQSLYRSPLPPSISFYMFCGYKGNNNPFGANNDGTISLSSIMDPRAQADAKMNYLFNEDHASILTSTDVLTQYNAILAETESDLATQRHLPGGFIDLRFSYNYPYDGIRPQPIFVLRTAERKEAVTVSYLSNQDSGKTYGPVAPGKYYASMLAAGGRATRQSVPVTISSNSKQALDFHFDPDGQINGYITTPLTPGDRSPGRPNVIHHPADKNIAIKSITLTGDGIHREVRPSNSDNIDKWGLYIALTDFCYEHYFGFFGLPKGEYTVVIELEDLPSIERHYSVEPGVQTDFQVIEAGN